MRHEQALVARFFEPFDHFLENRSTRHNQIRTHKLHLSARIVNCLDGFAEYAIAIDDEAVVTAQHRLFKGDNG